MNLILLSRFSLKHCTNMYYFYFPPVFYFALRPAESNNFAIKPSDISLLQDELDIPKDIAESLLRNNNGIFSEALRSYLRGN